MAASTVLIAPLSRKAYFFVLLPFVYGVAQAAKAGRRAALAWGAYTAAATWLWAGALLEGRRSAERAGRCPTPRGDPA